MLKEEGFQINIHIGMVTFCRIGLVYLSLIFLFFPSLSPSLCIFFQMPRPLLVVRRIKLTNASLFLLMTIVLRQTKSFSVAAVCLKLQLSSSLLILLSGCEVTISLIVGDMHTPQQLACAQIICYTCSYTLFLTLLHFSGSLPVFLTSSLHSIFSCGGGCHSSRSHICEVSAFSDKCL